MGTVAGQVDPDTTRPYVVNREPRHPALGRKRACRTGRVVYRQHLRFGQHRAAVGLAGGAAAPLNAVGHILCGGARRQVPRVAAGRHVAVVAHDDRRRQRHSWVAPAEGFAVRPRVPPHAIAVTVNCARPRPAVVWSSDGDEGPEGFHVSDDGSGRHPMAWSGWMCLVVWILLVPHHGSQCGGLPVRFSSSTQRHSSHFSPTTRNEYVRKSNGVTW